MFVRERFAWLNLFRALRLSLSPSTLILATVGAVIGSIGWWLAAQMFIGPDQLKDNEPLQVDIRYLGAFPGQRILNSCPLGSDRLAVSKPLIDQFGYWPSDPLVTVPYRICRPIYQMARPSPSWNAFFYYMFGGAWTLITWCFFGGCITRISVIHLGLDESLELTSSLKFGFRHLVNHLSAALLPVVIAFLLSLPFMLLGFCMRADIGLAIIGLFYGVMLPIAVLLAVVTLGWLFAWPLCWGVLSSDVTDSFDAVSRAYSYSCHRPLRYLCYLLFACLIGMWGWVVVWAISELVVHTGMWAVTAGMGVARMDEILLILDGDPTGSSLMRFGARVVACWNGFVRTVASAYGYGYFWCAFSAIYLLMRFDVDATEMDEIELGYPRNRRKTSAIVE